MFKKSSLDNGVRIITERIDHSRTVSVGFWVEVGARDEDGANNGSAHFVEHMLFKGTHSRSARQIAMEMDLLGGMSNAFTSNETTCFYATVLDSHTEQLIDLLNDIFLDSVFDPVELERERQVILQEISMVDDTPDDLVHELFASQLWGDHPLGNTVLGPREVVSSLSSADLLDYVRRHYTPDRILIAAAGNVEHDSFCSLLADRFTSLSCAGSECNRLRKPPAQIAPRRKMYNRPLEQMHMVFGTYGLPVTAEKRYALLLLNTVLGGNMSSRLFQEIRENRGLAYSVYSYLGAYEDSGSISIYAGVDPVAAAETSELIEQEVERIRCENVLPEELDGAKNYVKAGLFLSSENNEARMIRAAKNELYFGRYIPFEEIAAAIDRVSVEDMRLLAGQLLGGRALTVVGLGPSGNK
jgi:predicted Zn-dependent peptidase